MKITDIQLINPIKTTYSDDWVDYEIKYAIVLDEDLRFRITCPQCKGDTYICNLDPPHEKTICDCCDGEGTVEYEVTFRNTTVDRRADMDEIDVILEHFKILHASENKVEK